jgi:hypothetical protein
MLLVYPPIFNGNFRILKWRFCTIFLARYLRFLKWPLTLKVWFEDMVVIESPRNLPWSNSLSIALGMGLIWVYIRKLHPFTNQNQNE